MNTVPDFLAENNTCGQTILQLVSRGNAILAEILRLKDYIPKIFKLDSKQDVLKYADIILDFSYFQIAETQEQKIEKNETLRDLDEEFRDNHIEIITRFYMVFESIHTYVTDLNHFLEELEDGFYIHQTLETIFADMEGKQLLCESLYLYGMMLLMVDAHIDGPLRERLLVSYYRYTPQRRNTESCIDEICKLLRDTGYNSNKKPNNYPEDYFRRVSLKSNYVDMVIGRLRSDDIYGQLSVYPMPKHRSTALANQASMLYVCLFFSTNILHTQTSTMREIVDKYFPDNWVISVYMGFTINLVESWDSFKAAKNALNNTIDNANVKSYANSIGCTVAQLLQSLSASGVKESIVANPMNLLRECNYTIRWLMLHTSQNPNKIEKSKKCKQLRDLVIAESKFDSQQFFKLMLNTAQVELVTRDSYKKLLDEKEQQWSELKAESVKRLTELAEVFSGTKPLTRIKKNEGLQRCFLEISKEIDSLEQEDKGSSRKLVLLIQALEEVQGFHQLDSNMQVIQYLDETRRFLHQMIRNMNIKEDFLITLQIVGDLSYAWELIDTYTPIMQLKIKKEPTLVIKLRAIFLKLASALEIPLLRINQAHSEDLISVSKYYSNELEIYVRKVLQIIPNTMFEKMARIIQIQTGVLRELPTKVEKEKLKEYAQLDERFEFAELTHSVSVYSQGMRMMKSTLVGVVCLDPKKLLEDGIRKELVSHISRALNSQISFSSKPKPDELEQKLKSLGTVMDGYKRSFEYIQDYVNINGLKIWQEEVTRIINYNVEQECNGFLRNKIHAWESAYQSRIVPIPLYPPTDSISVNFIGRLAREIIRLTDPRSSVYLDQTATWYDTKTHKPILNKETMGSIVAAIEVAGLVGLDRLFSFMIITNLQKISGYIHNERSKNNTWNNIITTIDNEMKTIENMPNIPKFYQNCVSRSTKLWADLLECVLTVGQLQLIRNLIAFHLNKSCKFDAKNLELSLSSLNKALLMDIQQEKYAPSDQLMSVLSNYFDYSGMNNPFNKIYAPTKFNEKYALIIFIFVISHVLKLFLPQKLACLSRKTQEQFDGTAFTVGVHTVIKQVHASVNEEFIHFISNYIKDISRHTLGSKLSELSVEVVSTMSFMDSYTNYSEASQKLYIGALPEEIIHLHNSIISPVQ